MVITRWNLFWSRVQMLQWEANIFYLASHLCWPVTIISTWCLRLDVRWLFPRLRPERFAVNTQFQGTHFLRECFNINKHSLLISEILKQCNWKDSYLWRIFAKIVKDHKLLKPGNKMHANLLIFLSYSDHLKWAFFSKSYYWEFILLFFKSYATE